jgi:hypothetical protein
MRVYLYLFYRIYKLIGEKFKPKIAGIFQCVFLVSLALGMDITVLTKKIAMYYDFKLEKYYPIIITGIIFLINNILFGKIYDIETIKEKFKNETKTAYYLSLVSTIAFFIFTWLFFY